MAGVAHEFRDPFRERTNQRDQLSRPVPACQLKAGKVISRPASMPSQFFVNARPEYTDCAVDRPHGPGNVARDQRQIEGTAHPGNMVVFRDPSNGIQYRRQKVRVLVRVKVKRRDPSGGNPVNLFPEHFIRTNPAHEKGCHQLTHRGGQAGSLDENQVAADVETRVLAGKPDRIVKS
jgi:hypothetical protein